MTTFNLVLAVIALIVYFIYILSIEVKLKMFEGTYWSKSNRLKSFKIVAKDKIEAIKVLRKVEDFNFVCEWRS